MKTDEELIELWNKRNDTSRDYWIYHSLSLEEKSKVFDILILKKGMEVVK